MRSLLPPLVALLLLPVVAAAQTGQLDGPFSADQTSTAYGVPDEALTPYNLRSLRDRHVAPTSYELETTYGDASLAAPQEPAPCVPPEEPAWLTPLQTAFSIGWLPGSGDDLGMTTLDLYSSFAVGETGFVITPGGGVSFVDGPSSTDLPARLYNVSLDVLWQTGVSDRFWLELAVTPTYFSDFRAINSDAFRLLGRAIGYYAMTDTSQLVFGAVYLDLGDVSLLPIAGVIWAPRDDLRLELVFPQPVIGKRIEACEYHERWVYLMGEFGGGSWAIERAWGVADVANYSDLRLVAGLETRYAEGDGWRGEVGYVAGRWLDYNSGIGNYEPDSTAMVRLGFWF